MSGGQKGLKLSPGVALVLSEEDKAAGIAFQSLVVDSGREWFEFSPKFSAMTSSGIHLMTSGAAGFLTLT